MASEIQAVAYINLINIIKNKGIAEAGMHIRFLRPLPAYMSLFYVFLKPICSDNNHFKNELNQSRNQSAPSETHKIF